MAMDTAGIDRNDGVRARRSVVIQLETDEEASTRQEQTKQTTDNVLKSLSPLTNSMRLFGLYFSRGHHVYPDSVAASPSNWQSLKRCRRCNLARIYATVILVVTWFNAVRNCIVFHGNETIGAGLFIKLVIIPRDLLIAILHTAYYVASHTGSLKRVFCQVSLSPKYSLMGKVITAVCWVLVALNVIYYVYPIFNSGHLNDLSLFVIINAFHIPKPYADVLKSVFVVLQLQSAASWIFTQAMKYTCINVYSTLSITIELNVYSSINYLWFLYEFPQAMNYVVVCLLCGQFCKLNEEFSKCISGRGGFHGNFEQLRRRHQAISHSVKEADRFLMISNVACFCCHIVAIIILLFIMIFYPQETVLHSAEMGFLCIFWLVINVFGLSVSIGLAIILNNMASIRNYDHSRLRRFV